MDQPIQFHATTILAVRRNGQTAVAGDGQVTLGNTVMKSRARKVRRIYDGRILCGFAGAAADAFALFDRLEARVQEFHGNLLRAAVEVAKDWRLDKYLRRLEAMLVAADRDHLLLLSGTGEIIEPDDDILAIGSGGPYALAAARALRAHTELSAKEIAQEAMRIAAGLCIYTNEELIIETLE
ncbi:MAG: ATP-dependent protease subunit HslV [Candidatus Sumerlaea sp.]|jgi:ATP-dependent HslUV protease subunit HslV|uniref:ATP-dependent protease subunit HslV n=1 Tax=Sumerlaea chitinivorans TaxID=2250252 RepID=A0A2Z4Y7Q3_SUMC1|nr:ATP-dependent protease HslV [Candidatus Sumerlaea chitinivorans]GIX43860.1 MAG: ATP-dependent protease subunit HslV [Candidatus Sumerlaea sp.]